MRLLSRLRGSADNVIPKLAHRGNFSLNPGGIHSHGAIPLSEPDLTLNSPVLPVGLRAVTGKVLRNQPGIRRDGEQMDIAEIPDEFRKIF